MKILLNISKSGRGPFSWIKKKRDLARIIRTVTSAQVAINKAYILENNVPDLYESGVRYQREPRGQKFEEFAAIPIILARGWGDCDDLAPWRVAELRQKYGEKANIRIQWKPRNPKKPKGATLYHVVVRRENGVIEDPSLILGM